MSKVYCSLDVHNHMKFGIISYDGKDIFVIICRSNFFFAEVLLAERLWACALRIAMPKTKLSSRVLQRVMHNLME